MTSGDAVMKARLDALGTETGNSSVVGWLADPTIAA